MITPGLKSSPPWVWKYARPQDIQNELVSYTNPKYRLMINDIDLAGLVPGFLILVVHHLLLLVYKLPIKKNEMIPAKVKPTEVSLKVIYVGSVKAAPP